MADDGLIVTRAGGRELVALGDIDLATVSMLERAVSDIGAPSGGPVTLDMAGVTFMDSTGLNVLIRLTQEGYRLTLRHPSASVVHILKLTGLSNLFDVEAGLAEKHDD